MVTTLDKFIITVNEFLDFSYDVLKELLESKIVQINLNDILDLKNGMLLLQQQQIIYKFVENTITYWDIINNKNKKYFYDNIEKIVWSESYAFIFKALFSETPLISKDDEEITWEFLFSMIKHSIRYLFEAKNPNIVKDGNKTKITYNKSLKEVFPELNSVHNLNIFDLAKKWEMKLI